MSTQKHQQVKHWTQLKLTTDGCFMSFRGISKGSWLCQIRICVWVTGVKWVNRFQQWATPNVNLSTHLCPSSRNAKSPISRSRKRYRGGSDILESSISEVERWITSSTIPLSTSWLVATYPSFRLDWRKLMILDNTFATFFDTLMKKEVKASKALLNCRTN